METPAMARYDQITAKLMRGLTKGAGAEGLENQRGQLARRMMVTGEMVKLKAKYRDGRQYKHGRKGAGK